MRTLIVGAACCISASACTTLRGTPHVQQCAVGEDVVVSNQSLEWIRVNAVPKMAREDTYPGQIVRPLGNLGPGEEATYSVDPTARLQVMPIDRPLEPNGKVRIPKDIFVSCLEPID